MTALLRLLIWLHPRAFRERYGEGMLAFCGERLEGARQGGEPMARVWARTLLDLVVSAFIERLRAIARGSEHEPATPPPLPTGERMFALAQEFLFAVRSLRKNVTFSAAAVLTLALGIGATTAVFSIVESVMLRPLPFPQPGRIVEPNSLVTGGEPSYVSYADFRDWRDNHVFAKVAVYQQLDMDLTGPTEPVRVSAAAVTPEFFEALGDGAAQGRLLGPTDFPVSAPRAVVISDRLWRQQFGARHDILGQEVEINSIRRPIAGVLKPGERWPLTADVWVPLRFATEEDPDLLRRDNFIFQAIARLKDNTSLAATRTAMARLAALAEQANPAIRKNTTMVPTPLISALLGRSTPRALWVLLGAVGLLLLIGSVNVANLQLARVATRAREMAVRTALGASRWRLVRQTLVESGTLAVTGGALGAVLAQWLVRLIVAVAPRDVPRVEASAVNLSALAFALGVSLLVALVFGMAPALQTIRGAPAAALGEGGTRTSGSIGSTRTRRTLVALELALSVVLLVGAGLAVRSINQLRGVNVGFDAHHVLTASISLPRIRYNSGAKIMTFIDQFRERLAAAPGIEAAGITSASPLGAGGFYLGRMMVAEGRGPGPEGEVSILWSAATPGYFAALGAPLVRGRDFTAHDDSASAPVMIVNEAFAKAMFPGENALGKRAMSSRDEKVYREIVGVVGNVKYFGARDSTTNLVWVPYGQNRWGFGIVTVRTRGPAGDALPTVRHALAALDPGIALANPVTMDEAMNRSIASDRLLAILLGAFASLALALAAVGIFGVLAYMVERRSREMGIRFALGAQSADVMWLVVREAAPMVAIGVTVGLGVAFGLARVLQAMFYEVAPGDPLTFAGVAVLLSAVAIAAALVPARRAAKVDPLVALRSE